MNAPDSGWARLKINPDWANLPLFDRTGWKRLRFGAFADSVNERVEPADAAEEIYVGLEHLDPQDLHIRRWGKGSDVIGTKLRFRKGDIIFGRRRAYQRKLAVAEFDGICSAHAMVVRAKRDVVLPEFLPFLMMSDRFMKRAVEISVGSLSPTINWTALKSEEFAVPPVEEQRRLASAFWAADNVVNEAGRAADRATNLIKAELDAFLYGCNWHSRECRYLLKEGPKNGYSPQATSDVSGTPTLSIGAVRNGQVVTSGNVKFAAVDSAVVSQFVLRRDDVLVVRGNGNRTLCGRAGIVTETPEGCFYPDLLIRLRFREDALLSEFATLQWNEPKTHRRLLSKAKSTNGIWKINGKDVQTHVLATPPIEQQIIFLQRIEERSLVFKSLSEWVRCTLALRCALSDESFF